ncbi:hypothetical protein [Marinospirillum insulare]|uniref:Uncharacterized protein n=1 Tax=Marinospirillum insulare TaxID=217169 RepID=A0ABQ6A364_9GAMM|nr:hypothetical protein [Marinospirillum insulare]GLR65017.1 hypothetical protein GCM10007878_24560 [Marinospirillum insulare]
MTLELETKKINKLLKLSLVTIAGFFSLLFFFAVQASEVPASLEGEYSFVAKKTGGPYYYNNYLDSISAPSVLLSKQCPKKGKGDCWYIIKNNNGDLLKKFSTKKSVTSRAIGRYKNSAYMYFSESYRSGDKTIVRYYLIDNKGKVSRVDKNVVDTLAIKISYTGRIVALKSNGIYVDGLKTSDSIPIGLEYAEIGTNPQGDMAIIAIDSYGGIHLSDFNGWVKSDTSLTHKGDRLGVLSVHPADNKVHFSVYKYVNSYNKGLIYGRADISENKVVSGWLFNSENENIGFDPDIYKFNESILVAATNSSKSNLAYFIIPLNIDETKLAETSPLHIWGFENEKNLELILGTGVASLNWEAKADVKNDSTTYATTKYNLPKSLYKSVWLQGKWGNKQLAVMYAKNEAESMGGQAKKASKLINAVFDVNGLFGPRTSLRLAKEQSQLAGTASMSSDPSVNNLNGIQNTAFETKFDRYSGLVLFERGLYTGLVYETYNMPGMLGFSDQSKEIKYVGYDSKSQLKKYGLVVGYDIMDYARRYENNYNRFYYDGLIGFSFVDVKVSSELKDALSSQEKKLKSPDGFSIDAKLDLGYVYQRKFKKLSGLGYMLTAGYRVKASYLGSTQSDDDKKKLEKNEVALEFDRYDIWGSSHLRV